MTTVFNPEMKRYLLAESGEKYDHLEVYRMAYAAVRDSWKKAAPEGAIGYVLDDTGLKPKEFAMADGSMVSAPENLQELPDENYAEQLFGFKSKLDYILDGMPRSMRIGPSPRSFLIDWFDENSPILLGIPDPTLLVAGLRRQYGDRVVFPNGEDKVLPDLTGFREITTAEWDKLGADYANASKNPQ